MASPTSHQIPRRLRVVCILWLLAALFMTFNSTLCLTMWHFGGFKDRAIDGPTQGPFALFRYYGVMAAAQLAGALVLLIGAIAGLRRKPYGRLLLQIGCISGIVFILAFDVLWTTPLFDPPTTAFDRSFLVAFTVAGLVASLFFLAPPVATLWLLNRADVRSAFQRRLPVA